MCRCRLQQHHQRWCSSTPIKYLYFDHADVLQKVESEIQSNLCRLFAVVYLAGQQFKVTIDDIIQIQQHIPADVGERICLKKVGCLDHILHPSYYTRRTTPGVLPPAYYPRRTTPVVLPPSYYPPSYYPPSCYPRRATPAVLPPPCYPRRTTPAVLHPSYCTRRTAPVVLHPFNMSINLHCVTNKIYTLPDNCCCQCLRKNSNYIKIS